MTRAAKNRILIVALLIVGAATVLGSLCVGTETISLLQGWTDWRGGLSVRDSAPLAILVHQRLPRTLAALLAGCGLALAGCCFQALLRNPLATPYTLGVASAGSFGAWVATVAGASSTFYGVTGRGGLAFAFAMADIGVIYLIAARRTQVASTVLLLAGVSLGMLANAGMMLMRYFAEPHRLVMMDRWLMGGVNVLGYAPVQVLAVGVAPCVVVLLLQAPKFDQLGFGVEIAASRGVHVKRLQAVTFFVGSLLTAVIVSEVGPIGFVGLIVPHAVRTLTGSRHRVLMPLSALAGGIFLCLCDVLARVVLPGETPVGILTSVCGVPFFLYLLLWKRLSDWDG